MFITFSELSLPFGRLAPGEQPLFSSCLSDARMSTSVLV